MNIIQQRTASLPLSKCAIETINRSPGRPSPGALTRPSRLSAQAATVPPSGPFFTSTIGAPLSGSLSNPTFNWTETSLVQPNKNTVTLTYSFTGSLTGGVVTGTLSYSFRADDATTIGTGSLQMPVTLR